MESTICGTVFSNVKFISEAYNKKTDFSGCVFKNVLFDYHIFSGNFRGAVFSDIHGNYQALDTILNDIKNENIDKIIFLGDSVSLGPLL